MENQQWSDTLKRRVFLSYVSADKEIARQVVDKLNQEGINVWFRDYELNTGDSLVDTVMSAVAASDYIIVLLSPNSVTSPWLNYELGIIQVDDLINRGITLVPVVIADCEIPTPLLNYQYLDLREDFDNSVVRLAKQISAAPKIDFSLLDVFSFEKLIIDLLVDLGFSNVEQGAVIGGSQIDVKANYSYLDPFGVIITDTWLIEVKFYRKDRVNLDSISQLAGYLSGLSFRSKGLLVTNGQLTSTARDWLKSTKVGSRAELRVIEGTELKRLLLLYGNLISKYFGQDTGQ